MWEETLGETYLLGMLVLVLGLELEIHPGILLGIANGIG